MAMTTEEADLVHGRRFRLYRVDPTSNARTFICLGITMSLQRTAEFDDATAPKCSVPDAVPDRKSQIKSRGWMLNFSGKADDERLKIMETDYEDDTTNRYVIATIPPDGTTSGTEHVGDLFYENITREKSDNGFVTFSCQCRGDGKLTRGAPAATPST